MAIRRPCPVCRCTDVVPINGGKVFPHGMDADICTRCGLVYTNPMFTDDEKAARSPDHRLLHRSRSTEMDLDRAFQHSLNRMQRTWATLAPHVHQGQQALEVASGDGALLYLLQRAGAEVTGIDKDHETANRAANRLQIVVHTSAFEEHNFKSTLFDLIVMSHCIEHFFDPVMILRRACSLLKPNGTLFLETPNILRPKVGPRRIFSLAHNFHFSPRTLSLALFHAGLTVTRMVEFGRDVFQIVATPSQGKQPVSMPWTDSWQSVEKTVRTYRKHYYTRLQFLWRKMPFIRVRMMNRVLFDHRGSQLQHWLAGPMNLRQAA